MTDPAEWCECGADAKPVEITETTTVLEPGAREVTQSVFVFTMCDVCGRDVRPHGQTSLELSE